jgi:opacity protein-like surface antigen
MLEHGLSPHINSFSECAAAAAAAAAVVAVAAAAAAAAAAATDNISLKNALIPQPFRMRPLPNIYSPLQGGLDRKKSTHLGVKFRHLVGALYSSNKQHALKPSLILS